MKKLLRLLAAIASLTLNTEIGQCAVIQFGGDANIITDPSFQSQIGASQVIQWNGVNSAGGGFGASGTVSNVGIGATLASLAPENLVLTSRAIGTTDPNATPGITFASGTPNILGVIGGDNAKFDANFSESWTFDFDQEARLKYLVFSALGFDGETIELTLEGSSPISFNRTDPSMSPVTYGSASNRYVYTVPDGGALLSPGDDVTIASTQGTWGLQGVVVESPPSILGVTLEVDPNTGAFTMKNDSGADIEMDYYEIRSTSSLNPSGWNSLQDQDLPSFPAGNGTGNGWEVLSLASPAADFNVDGVVDGSDLSQWEGDYGINGNSDADGDADTDGFDFLAWQRSRGETEGPLPSLFSEGFLTGTSILAKNSSVPLGNGFQVGAARNLVFKVRLADGTLLDGDVQYVSAGTLAAVVPEPSSGILFLLGLGIFPMRSERRRNRG